MNFDAKFKGESILEMFWSYFWLPVKLLIPLLVLYGFVPHYKLWKSGFIYPTPILPFLGNMLTIYQNGFLGAQKIWSKQLGRMYAVAQSFTVVIDILEPTLLKEILVKNFSNFPNRREAPVRDEIFKNSIFVTKDEEWKRVRKLIVPTFTSHKIKTNMFPLMCKGAQQLAQHMKQVIKESNNNQIVTIDAKDYFGCLTMDVIASTAFGLDLDSFGDKNHQFVICAKKIFVVQAFDPLFALSSLFPFMTKIFKFFNFSITDQKSLDFFAQVVRDSIEKRKKFNIKRNDYLQLLIDSKAASDEKTPAKCPFAGGKVNSTGESSLDSHANDAYDKEVDTDMTMTVDFHEKSGKLKEEGKFTDASSSGAFTEVDMISNSLLFFIAGYETTANALSWISRALAWNPEVQEIVRDEIMQKVKDRQDQVTKDGSNGGNKAKSEEVLSYEDILELEYLDCVIKEVLRLHPPLTVIDRVASNDFTTEHPNDPKKTITFKKGTIVEVPIYALHHDENLWPDPDTFDPGRFMTDDSDSPKDYQYQYMPFGCGPRNCIGLRFATLEMKVCLIVLLTSGIKFVPAPGDMYKELIPENTPFRVTPLNIPKLPIKIGITLDM